MKAWIIVLILLAGAGKLMAQSREVPENHVQKFEKMLDSAELADTLAAGMQQADTTYDYMHRAVFWYTFEQNKKVFAWQHTSSIIIFCLVVIIVLMGIYMSYEQFRMSKKLMTSTFNQTKQLSTQSAETMNAQQLELMQTDMELGKDGIKIKTAVIGLVILCLSLAFLFMYLKYVYPISIVQTVQQ